MALHADDTAIVSPRGNLPSKTRITGCYATMAPTIFTVDTRGFMHSYGGAKPYSRDDRSGIVFTLTSKDGEEGYPGELKVSADYGLDEKGCLFIDLRGETDKTTIINLVNHTYWNLSGIVGGTIRDMELYINASHYLPVDEHSIPLGKLKSVQGTPFDFQRLTNIGEGLDKIPGGYDHCMVIKGERGKLRVAAEALDPASGRKLTLMTDRPGLQFYTGNYLNGHPFPKHGGLCLETQDFPDAPNQPGFPSVVLHPGETYHHRSIIEFSVQT